ncbi:xyloglucan galactosyltransferase KATAMARI1 homolog [Setaria italica]|uniref:xyloglucan galactosyltransferase KATAMARI1 homolog n=1 Tax=Setaria italica TaxID=4555 RepID=UPI000BE4C5A3|nr:xyloglucan galactosyltransferase KATAMARI1 homolog [Setaria italica]
MQLSVANSIIQLLSKTAAKGGGVRSRRAVGGAKGVEKAAASALPPLRLLAILAVIAWTLFLYLQFSVLSAAVEVEEVSHGADSADPCRGRYVYVHDLPPRFNADIIRDCRKTEDHWGDMCGFVSNAGLGRPLADRADGVITGEAGWYGTHQFALDFIFHNRMRQYECLTNHSAVANAVFVPFYAGFDFARYHWGYDNTTRDAASVDLAEWLMARPQWRRMGGRDHFLVAGRTGWDFRRSNNVDPDWGNDLLAMPAGRNMSVLVLESTFLHSSDYSVPYPTYFHPRSDADVLRWQDRVRGQRREWLMAFVGAPRPDVRMDIRIRDHVIAQCKASSACALLACARAPGSPQCHAPGDIMRLFQKATFCLQPPGDSCTRRSVFDSMVAGCIPVFFHTASAYKQYRWHLPKDHLNYSVYIPDADVRRRNVSIEAVLRAIPPDTVERMREEVIKLIPRVSYADPRSRLETIKDAFDVAVEGVLDTVARIKKGEYVDSGRPVSEDPPNLYVSTESRFGPKSVVSRIMMTLKQWIQGRR